jgi:hypothetical protein
MSQKAFTQATKESTGCTVAGTSGTLFEYAVPAISLVIKYCFDTEVKDQLLSLSFQGSGSSSAMGIEFAFSAWDPELPAASTFEIPASCACKQ